MLGDEAALDQTSAEIRRAMEIAAEVLGKLKDAAGNYIDGLTDYEAGKIAGRFLFEIVNALYGGEILEFSKLSILTKLADIAWIKETPALAAIFDGLKTGKLFAALSKSGGPVEDSLISLTEHIRDIEKLDETGTALKVVKEVTTEGRRLEVALPELLDRENPLIFAAANGDSTKVETAKDWYEAMGATYQPQAFNGKGGWVYGAHAGTMEVHHATPIAWTRQLFENLGKQLTQADIDSMPAMLLRKLDHTGKLSEGGFHAMLRTLLKDGERYDSAKILENLQEAYRRWNPDLGPKVWAVARDWLSRKGV